MFSWNPLAFSDPTDVAFSKSNLNIWKFLVHALLKLNLKDFEHNLAIACEINAIVQWFEHSLSLPFFGIGMKADFQSCGHC